MGLLSWYYNLTSTYPGDKDGDGTLDQNETADLLRTNEDNSLKALIRAQDASAMNQGIIEGVGEAKYCLGNELTKGAGGFGTALQFLTGSTNQHYDMALNQYLQTIKTDDGYDQHQVALKLSGIDSGDEFAGLENIELPNKFCAIRKANPDSPKR